MTDKFFRVQADVAYVGEWFVPIDENVQTPEDAAEYIRSAVEAEEPENYLQQPVAFVNSNLIWVTDENGEEIA